MEIYNNLYDRLEMVKIKWSCGNFNFEEECKWGTRGNRTISMHRLFHRAVQWDYSSA